MKKPIRNALLLIISIGLILPIQSEYFHINTMSSEKGEMALSNKLFDNISPDKINQNFSGFYEKYENNIKNNIFCVNKEILPDITQLEEITPEINRYKKLFQIFIGKGITLENDLDDIRKAIKINDAQWVADYTSVFSPFSPWQRGSHGLIDDEITHYEDISFNVTIPDIFDWRNVEGVNYMTPIRDQGECGSCTAFAILSALEAVAQIHVGTPCGCDLSEAHLFSCAGGDCRRGLQMSKARDYIRRFGVPDAVCFPYDDRANGCGHSQNNWQKRVVKVSNINAILPSFDNICNALLTYGPLVTCMDVFEDFYSYTGGVYQHVWGDFCGRHSVTIVGYNNKEGYWICKNSWGTDWGEDGWFNIRYGQCDIGDPIYYLSGVLGNIQPFAPCNQLLKFHHR